MSANLDEIITKNENEINAEVKQVKKSIRSKHDERIARLIREKGFDAAFQQMMNKPGMGWIEAKAWIRASARASRLGQI